MKTLIVLITLFNLSIAIAKPNGKWQFRFQSSFSVSDYNAQKDHISIDERQKGLNLLVRMGAMGFNNHADRLSFFQNACKGLSEKEIFGIARYLSSQLENIYDYSRIDVNTNKVVQPHDQWSGLSKMFRTGQDVHVGICKDTSTTVAEFLISCGISPNQISVESYRSHSGGHQVVNILGSDGKTYTINWSELYSQNTNFRSHEPKPGIVNSGIVHTRYHPITGKIMDERYTELGHILTAVTGGKVDDENYLPQLIQLEANNRVLTVGAFFSQTSRNDFLKGIKISYEKSPRKWFHLTTGLAYAHIDINHINTKAKLENISQHIIYYQFHGAIDIKEIHFLKFENHSLYLKNTVNFDLAAAGILTNFRNEYFPNFDITIRPSLNSNLIYKTNNFKAQLTGGIDLAVNERAYNQPKEGHFNNGTYPIIYHRGHYINTRLILDHGKLQWALSNNSYFYSYGKFVKFNIDLLTRNKLFLISAGHLRYSDQLSLESDFLVFQIKMNWLFPSIGLIGLGLQGQLSLDDMLGDSLYLKLSYTPSEENRD